MPTWPGTLPQKFQQQGFQDEEPDLVIKEQMDTGPPITRRRCTASSRPFGGEMIMDATQKATLQTFYRDYCASEFDFPDPDTGSTISVMFAEKPKYKPTDGIDWMTTVKLVEMP